MEFFNPINLQNYLIDYPHSLLNSYKWYLHLIFCKSCVNSYKLVVFITNRCDL